MAARAINRTLGDKPEGPVTLNRSHPLADGLVLDWIGGAFPLINVADPADTLTYPVLIPSERMTPEGLGTTFIGDATDEHIDLGSAVWLSTTEPFTVAYRLTVDVLDAGGFGSLQSDGQDWRILVHDSVNYQDISFGSNATWVRRQTNANSIPVGSAFTLVVRYDGVLATAASSFDVTIDGLDNAHTPAGAFGTPTTTENIVGLSSTGGNAIEGTMFGVRLWPRRRLNDTEVLELSSRYWAPFGMPLELSGIKRRAFFAPVAGLITQTVTATAQGIASRQVTVFKTISATATGVANVVNQVIGALVEQSVTAVATGVAAVQKTVLKSIPTTASGIAVVATQVISGLTEVAVTAVATGVATVQKTVFKTVRATASGLAQAAASTGALILQAVVAVAQGIAKRQVMVLKTVKDFPPRPVVVDHNTSFAFETSTFKLDMPEVRPDGDLYILVAEGAWDSSIEVDGWTLIVERSDAFWTGYRIGDNEPISYTVIGDKITWWHGSILRIVAANALDPIEFAAAVSVSGGGPTAPSLTPSLERTLMVFAGGWNADDVGDQSATDVTTVYIEDQTDTSVDGGPITSGTAVATKDGQAGIASGTVSWPFSGGGSIQSQSATIIVAPPQPSTPPVAKAIVQVFRQVITNILPFTGHGGLGFVDKIQTRWRRRRSNWRRRR